MFLLLFCLFDFDLYMGVLGGCEKREEMKSYTLNSTLKLLVLILTYLLTLWEVMSLLLV